MLAELYALQQKTGRDVQAYGLIFETLEWIRLPEVSKSLGFEEEMKHLTGQQLCDCIFKYSVSAYGLLGYTVWQGLGIHGTEDIGTLVYDLVGEGLIGKQDADEQEDFDDVFCAKSRFNNVQIEIGYDLEIAQLSVTYSCEE